MQIMAEALQRRAGGRLEGLLRRMTRSRWAGFFTGLAVTAAVQSSSAAMVMVVGFVNSGMLTLRQAVGVIMGTNVGTTVTPWLLSLGGLEGGGVLGRLLRPAGFVPLLSLWGIAAYLAGKGSRRDTGQALLGFAILMQDMEIMTAAVSGLARAEGFRQGLERINAYHRLEAMRLQLYARKNLYHDAVRAYLQAVENGYPVMVYEVIAEFTVTYNQNCALSLYTDQYIFTGGAHGSTTRYANTWDLKTGTPIPLGRLVPGFMDGKAYITGEVIRQIRTQMQNGEGDYFEDYEKNAVEEFDPGQFYLTPEGVVVYYQQYAIAPYSSGIPVFLIPYSKRLREPRC